MATTINIYLNFNGNCEEAFLFYKSVFGGEFDYFGRYGEMPPQEGFEMPEEFRQKVLHVSLPISAETALLGCDTGHFSPKADFGNNFSISINTHSKEEADRMFSMLTDGGQVQMPMDITFWGAYYGMCTDRYGINWMINVDLR